MKFTLIVCTYQRSQSLLRLLQSVRDQNLYPNEILIIDGSSDDDSKSMLAENDFENLTYYKVEPEYRGLTKQRNFGLAQVDSKSDVIAFLDDDTVLLPDYFKELIDTFVGDGQIVGVGGIAVNENKWFRAEPNKIYNKNRFFQFEGYVHKEGQRNVVRNFAGLQSHLGPGRMPNYSHGKTCGFPLTGKTHEVDLLIGMSFAFRKRVFESIGFSTFFEGYGLYEDADFSIRALEFGTNVINTKVQLNHYHHPSGRPNQYQYGKMVVRNGWYVWRVKNPNPSVQSKVKWHAITLLLTAIRLTNIITTSKRKEAFTESIGRIMGWFSLWFTQPK